MVLRLINWLKNYLIDKKIKEKRFVMPIRIKIEVVLIVMINYELGVEC